jgi:hypothetical protein
MEWQNIQLEILKEIEEKGKTTPQYSRNCCQRYTGLLTKGFCSITFAFQDDRHRYEYLDAKKCTGTFTFALAVPLTKYLLRNCAKL